MANKLQALVYAPVIDPGKPVHNDETVEHQMERSGASRGEVFQATQNFVDMLRHYLRHGRSVHVDDLGTFWVEATLAGDMNIHFRPDPDLKDEVKFRFEGVIKNSENIGKTMADLIALWNADPAHANDQIPTS